MELVPPLAQPKVKLAILDAISRVRPPLSAVGAVGVEAPLEHVALNDEGAGDLAVASALGGGTNIDEQAPHVHDLLGSARRDPAQALPGFGQEAVDCAQGAQAGSAR